MQYLFASAVFAIAILQSYAADPFSNCAARYCNGVPDNELLDCVYNCLMMVSK
ncbi:hypothetical protein FQR65_LT06402 [Abscondita terminalis]|nr:hypothetical protein FQR65_LT06402 [Abscondita terminalis]